MTATTEAPAIKKVAPKTLISEGGGICGYCNSNVHDQCPGKIRNADRSTVDAIWTCACGCITTPKCLDCKHAVDGEVGPDWTCLDEHACAARRQAKLDANLAVQRMRSSEMVSATATQKKATKVAAKKVPGQRPGPAAPKVGKCLHTGKPTKGGKFAPGQDAAYVSAKVKAVQAKQTTEAAVRKEMEGHGLSEALIAKFTKGAAIAREKAAKAAAAEAEAKAAKAKPAKAVSAAKSKPGPKSVSSLLKF